MRRLASLILAIVVILVGAVPMGAAPSYAAESGERVVYRQVALMYFDVWKHSNGDWQDTNPSAGDGRDWPGQTGKKTSYVYTVPDSVKDNYDLTKVEVISSHPEGDESRAKFKAAFEAAGGLPGEEKGYHGQNWDDYNNKWYKHRAEITGIEADQSAVADGKSKVTWTLNLTTPEERPYNIKDPVIRAQLGLPGDPRLNDVSEGYRYMLPAIIVWYGVPKHKPISPNLSVTYFDPGVPVEGDAYVAEAGKTYTATVRFKVGEIAGDRPEGVNYPPYSPVVAAAHKVGGTYYQARIAGDKIIESDGYWPAIPQGTTVYSANFERDGEEITARFDWTAEDAPETTLAVAINKDYPDRPDNLPYTLWRYGEVYPELNPDDPGYWAALDPHSPVYQDNVAEVSVRIERQPLPDFYVADLDPGTQRTEPGGRYTASFTAGLKEGFPAPTPAVVTVKHNGADVPGYPQTLDFAPGEAKSLSFGYTGQDGDSNLEVTIAPVGWDDADWSNNSARATVPGGLPDLETVSLTGPASPADPTKMFALTARFRNNSGREMDGVQVAVKRDGRVVKSARMDFKPGETKTLSVDTAGNAGKRYVFEAVVDPDDKVREADEGNNAKTLTVQMGAAKTQGVAPPPEGGVRLVD